MAKDISEELYANIKKSFDAKYEKAQLLGEPLHDVFARIKSGDATFRDADMYAVEVGSMLSDSMKEHLILDEMPNKTFYRNIAQKTLGTGLKDGYGLVSNISAVIQEEMNEDTGIGLNAVKPKLDVQAVDKIVNRASGSRTQEELDAALTEPVKTFTRSVVDDTQKANARLHDKAGLEVKVEREYDGVGLHEGTDVCDWCVQRAGTWTYDEALAAGVFERHEGCGCIITYTSKKGEVTRSTGKYSGWEKSSPYQRIANAAAQEGDLVTIPPFMEGFFDDCHPLSISDEERETFQRIYDKVKQTGCEYGEIITSKEHIPCESKESGKVLMDTSAIDEYGLKLYHGHTNDTLPSQKDLSRFVYDEKVDATGVITRNGDIFIVTVGDGYIPDEREYWNIVSAARSYAERQVIDKYDISSLTEKQIEYLIIREKNIEIVRQFGWRIEGGKL